MESLISFFVFVFIILLGLIITKHRPDPSTIKSNETELKSNMKVNGVDIHLSPEEINKIESNKAESQYEQFLGAKDNLIKSIITDMNKTDDLIRKKVLEALLKRKVETIDDYIQLDYLYNDGKLRSSEEADYMERYFKYQNERNNYDKERHKINTLSFVIPFLSIFFITCAATNNIIFGIPLGLLFGLSGALIGMSIGYSINIKKANEYGMPHNDPRVVQEINKRRASILAIIGVTITTAHHTKNAVKDVINVESWKEMK